MKAKIIIFSILALLFGKIDTFAQSVNRLSIPEIEGKLGKELSVPVYMTNDDEITGIQVNIHFPQGAQVNVNSASLSDRKDNHTVTARSLGNGNYLFVIFSASNKPVKGNSGTLFTVPVTIPMDWMENSVHPFVFNQVILSSAQGDNLATESDPGAIRVIAEPRPDFTVENVQVNKTGLSPGDKFTATWTVKNIGDIATSAGWSEQILLVDDNGKQTSLGSLYHDGIISIGNSVNRQAEFALSQLPGIEGNVKLSVRIIPDANAGELPGDQGNNTAKSAQYLTIEKKLLLELPQYAIPENSTASIQCKLSRSGNWSEQQIFTLSTDYPQRISLPASVTIPAQQSGAYFYLKVTDNTILDLDSLVTITASGNGYETITGKIVIEDNELIALSLTASKTEINEGETFTLTVERSRASDSELTVLLNCNYPKRFEFPAQITIPAGQKSANATVKAIDDNIPDMTRDVEFTASAPKHQSAKRNIVLHDDDIPEITLTLTPQTVSESAGPLAVKAVLKRLTKKDGNITVALSDNSNGSLYYSAQKLTMAAGVEEAQFTIGVIDNANMEGDRTIDVTASVYISSCNCSITGTSAGVVKAQLTILDDDGPSLKIVSSQTMLQEGKTNASILTVTRNTATTQSLTVTVSSDHDSELIYDRTVTIPAGSASVEIPVSVHSNEITEGDRTVVFTATADGFTKGFCWVMITDQTLPDAVISSISLSDTELQVEEKTTLKIVVSNAGAAALPQVPVNIYLSGVSSPLTTLSTQKTLAVNESDTIIQMLTMPNTTGNHTIHAVVNEKQTVKELLYLNNTSEKVSIRLLPKFTATATTDKTVYKQGEAVVISGLLTGNGTANAAVEVYIVNSGIRQTIDAVTDASGRFQATFQPSVYQSGHFAAGACYPKEGLTTEQANFDIYGIKRTDSGYITHDLTVGETYQSTLRLTNTGTLPLNNLRAEIIAAPENATIAFTPISSVAGNATVTMNYTLMGNAPSESTEWQEIKIRIISDESNLLEATIYAYFRTATGKLESSISSIRTTMTKGASRDYPLTITNVGKGATGKISLSLPASAAWLGTATPREMPSLATNESATIILRFTPADNLPINVPINGNIGVNCETGVGLPLSFSIEPVSESTGTLEIDVCDEYTYYTVEAPHVAGAKVLLKHPVTGAIIREGLTNSSGLFAINDLPEGYYSLEVSADKHDSYKNNILVDPGKTTKKVVNLSFQAITINWNVEETEVEDEYEIVTTVTYETNVPVPVVVTELPEQLPVEELLDKGVYMFNAILTNKGLITAHDVQLTFVGNSELLFEYPTMGLSLRPQESVVIPVKVLLKQMVSPVTNSSGLRSTTGIELPCRITSLTIYAWDCGLDRKWHQYPLNIKVLECKGINFEYDPTLYDPPTLPPPVYPRCKECNGGNGGNGWMWEWDPPLIKDDGCEPCQNSFLFAMAKCFVTRIPVVATILEIIEVVECVQSVIEDGEVKCVLEMLIEKPEWIEKIIDYINIYEDCIKPLFSPCEPGFDSSPSLRSGNNSYPDYILHYQEVLSYTTEIIESSRKRYLEVFGNEVWLNVNKEELSALCNELFRLNGIITNNSPIHNLKPNAITDEYYELFIERWNNTVNNIKNTDNYIDISKLVEQKQKMIASQEYALSLGYSSVGEMFMLEEQTVMKKLTDQSSSVCATISLQFSQTMTMTRQAFRGTLTVYNGHESIAMENVRLNLVVRDENGNIATSHEFQINNESMKEFGGDLNGYWSLDAKKTGSATVVFIPTKYAAPTVPVNYSFGGSLSYTDPFTGLEVKRDLYPATLTVNPSPNLDLTYFMQRDILGDDPLTPEVEPIIPAEFSLLIHNVGVGEATNIRMVTQQPKIVDNQKGLFIDFELFSSQLNGGEHTLALGGSVPTEFGNIPTGKTAYAQWWFSGSLLGHFTEYDVQATHVSSYGNPDLTLLNEVSIHELIRSIRTKDTDQSLLTGFMVNDIPDAEDLPDRLYLSNGTIESVAYTGNITCVSEGNNQYRLTVTPSAIGWNYGAINDPTVGRQQLVEIKRVSDNAVIDLRNCWQTDRTLRDGKDPLYENKLHLAEKFGSGSEQYLLSFTPRPDVFLEVEAFESIPTEVSSTAVQEVTVRFNKNIDAATFTTDDIRLICQGENRDAGLISITPLNERTFKLDLSAVTQSNGYYVLTVQTSDITDYENHQGQNGKTANWNQYFGGKMQFNLKIEPEAGGTVTPIAGQYDYNSILNLQAVPNEGYLFEKWTVNGEILSTEPAYNFMLISEKALTATFKLKLYDVTVSYNRNAGTVTGGGNGKYEHGSHLILRVEPLAGYIFEGWKVNGENKSGNMLDITVEANISIEALFIRDYVNTAPVGISLSSLTFRQDASTGTVIGVFTTEDDDDDETFTYSLASGTNDTHNGLFAIQNDSLVTNDNFICKKEETYHIRVRTADAGNLSFEKAFNLSMIKTAVTDTARISESICQGGAYDFFGQSLTAAGVYRKTLQTVLGCDSVVQLTLTVIPRPATPSVSVEGTHTLVSSAPGGNQWYDGNGAVGNATGQSFTPTVSGIYYVIAVTGNCESEPSESYFVNLSNEIKIDWSFIPQWNWFSINSLLETPIESLLSSVKSKIDRIVGSNSEAVNDESGFTGNLKTLIAKESYKFKVNAAGTMTLSGAVSPVEDHPIQLNTGWNWIGYLPVVGLTSADALSGLSPSTNDVVKNQTDFSVYDGQKWVGTLTDMKPGEGYMYFSATAKTFAYPALRAAKVRTPSLRATKAVSWEYDTHQYRDNMNIIAQLLADGQVLEADAYTVGAFCGNECRGIGKYVDGRLFITVHGENTGERISFKAYENATGKEYTVEESLSFSDELKGKFSQPVTLNMKGYTSLDHPEFTAFNLYPNPVKGMLYLSGSNPDRINGIKILNITGSVIWATDSYKGEGINVGFLSTGSYILAIRLDNEIVYRKFVKSN
jgi:hypothetical protein